MDEIWKEVESAGGGGGGGGGGEGVGVETSGSGGSEVWEESRAKVRPFRLVPRNEHRRGIG